MIVVTHYKELFLGLKASSDKLAKVLKKEVARTVLNVVLHKVPVML